MIPLLPPPCRRFALRYGLICTAVFLGGRLPAQEPDKTTTAAAAMVNLRVEPDAVIAKIPGDFLGFGYESSAAAQTDFFSVKNTHMMQLYRTLSPHGLIRIGGNVSDHTRYVAGGTPAPHTEREVTVVNRQNLLDLGEFLRATGWKAIWGLNLGTGSKEEAAAEAVAVTEALGDRLDSLQIGNEVDALPRFARSYEAYHAAYLEYKAAIRAVLPKAVLSGPDTTGKADWCVKFAATEGGDLHLLTDHYYYCGQGNPLATLANLLRRDTAWDQTLAALHQACQGRNFTYRICEVNSFFGGGKPGVSDTFGSALWCLDYLFVLASNGCGGVNMETDVNHLGWVSHYSPIFRDAAGRFSARPEYAGMLAFSLAGNGDLLKLTQETTAGINLSAYATRNDQGQLWVTIINKDLTQDADVKVALPGDWATGQGYPLCAPSVESKDRVTLAGTEVSADGKWTAGSPVPIKAQDGVWRVAVPHASALLLQLRR